VHVDAPRASLRAWATYLLILAAAVGCAALTGCAKPMEMPFTGVTKTQPDEHGVVCYNRQAALSCVKVK
jgi:hypothetical protein